jgi:hypothetical protein
MERYNTRKPESPQPDQAKPGQAKPELTNPDQAKHYDAILVCAGCGRELSYPESKIHWQTCPSHPAYIQITHTRNAVALAIASLNANNIDNARETLAELLSFLTSKQRQEP